MVIDQTLENELYDNGIYEAWQFVINTVTTLSTARYCKETIPVSYTHLTLPTNREV